MLCFVYNARPRRGACLHRHLAIGRFNPSFDRLGGPGSRLFGPAAKRGRYPFLLWPLTSALRYICPALAHEFHLPALIFMLTSSLVRPAEDSYLTSISTASLPHPTRGRERHLSRQIVSCTVDCLLSLSCLEGISFPLFTFFSGLCCDLTPGLSARISQYVFSTNCFHEHPEGGS